MPDLLTDTEVISEFIRSLGWDDTAESGFPLVPGPPRDGVTDMPDQMVILTGGGGPGFLTEEAALDAGTFQARTRGKPNDPLGAERAAKALDLAILRARFPAIISGVTVSNCFRLGSGPSPLGPDDGYRSEFVCNYVLVSGTQGA